MLASIMQCNSDMMLGQIVNTQLRQSARHAYCSRGELRNSNSWTTEPHTPLADWELGGWKSTSGEEPDSHKILYFF